MKTTIVSPKNHDSNKTAVWDDCRERASLSAYAMREAVNQANRKAGLLKRRMSRTNGQS